MKSVLLVFLLAPALLHGADHPRLLLGKEDVPALREKVKSEPFASMLARMKADANLGAEAAGSPEEKDSDYFVRASRNGFLYLATGDDAYAKASREAVEKLFTFNKWGTPNVKGLSLYNAGVHVALAYDFCHGAPSWDAEFSDRISKELLKQHEVIFKSGGREQNSNPASNWQGLRWSSAGVTLLATDEPADLQRLKPCFDRVVRYLNENIGTAAGSRGWNIEGLGYTFYPMGSGVLQFAVAARRVDSKFDLLKVPGMPMALWTVYAALVPTSNGLLRPDFGDDNPHANGESCYGFAFATCPPELLPGIKYWYDRTVGAMGNKTFDNARFGIASSILYYPAGLAEKDPLSIPAWREAFIDTKGNGMLTYRNHYKDSTDIVAQLYVKLRGNKGHSGPDALSFRIVGLDTIWATGGGRYGIKSNGQDAYLRSMNTLYPVDPDTPLRINGNPGKIVGTPVIDADGSGSSVASIPLNNVGTANHTRRFLSSFRTGANAAFVISDTSDDGKFWQMATLGTNTITTDKNTFTITSPKGDTLKGTVLYPPDPVFKTGTRPRGSNAGKVAENNFIHFSSEDGDYLVVLTLAEKGKSHPAVSAAGVWSGQPDGKVTVGNATFAVSGDTIAPL